MANNNSKNAYLLAIQVPNSILEYLIPNQLYLQFAEAYFSGALRLVKNSNKKIVVRFIQYNSASKSFGLATDSNISIALLKSPLPEVEKVIFARTAKVNTDLTNFNLQFWYPDYEIKLENKNTSIDRNNAIRWLAVWVKKIISAIEDPNFMLEFKKEPSKQFLSGTHWLFRDYIRFADHYLRSLHLTRIGKKLDAAKTKVDMDRVLYQNIEKYLWEFGDWITFYKQWVKPENREYKPVTDYKDFYAKYLKLANNFTKFQINLRLQFKGFYIQEYNCLSVEDYAILNTACRNNLLLFSSMFLYHVFCTKYIPQLYCA